MKLRDVKYKGFVIDITYDDHMGDTFSCVSGHISSHNPSHINGGYPTIDEALRDIKNQINDFLEIAPKSWEELAMALSGCAVFSESYEFSLDPDNVKILIENFLRATEK